MTTGKQKRTVYWTIGGKGTNLDPGTKVSPRIFTKASLGKKIKSAK